MRYQFSLEGHRRVWDYASHLALWEFLRNQMDRKLDDKFRGQIFTYHPDRIRENLADAVNIFERSLLS